MKKATKKPGRKSLAQIEKEQKGVDIQEVDRQFAICLSFFEDYRSNKTPLAEYMGITLSSLSVKFSGNKYGNFSIPQKIQVISYLKGMREALSDL